MENYTAEKSKRFKKAIECEINKKAKEKAQKKVN